MKRTLKKWAVLLCVVIVVLPLLVFTGCSSNGSATTQQTPLQELQTRVTALETWKSNTVTTDLSSLRRDLNQLRADLDALANVAGQDYSDELATINDTLSDLEGRLDDLEADGGGSTTLSLQLAILSSLPTIVNDGSYSFTVRITNTVLQPETGMIVFQLHAYSGSCSVTSASISGSPIFGPAEYYPLQSATDTITLFSEQLVIGASSSKIYQFSLSLNQSGVPFEWIPVLSIAQ